MLRDGLAASREAYKSWEDKYSPMEFFEYDGVEGVNTKMMETVDSAKVWTVHSTCDSEKVTSGFHVFKSVCGCWSVFGWWVSSKDYSEEHSDESFDSCFYCECECFDEETEEGKPDCPECGGDGWLTHYFD